jgi:hypothetical protein
VEGGHGGVAGVVVAIEAAVDTVFGGGCGRVDCSVGYGWSWLAGGRAAGREESAETDEGEAKAGLGQATSKPHEESLSVSAYRLEKIDLRKVVQQLQSLQ